jgi:hypothetical protein
MSTSSARYTMFANSIILRVNRKSLHPDHGRDFNIELLTRSETEQALFDRMASHWRQMRVWGIERATITRQIPIYCQ